MNFGKNQIFLLDNWKQVADRLHGNVFNNPKFASGEYIVTSRIISQNGHYVTTQSGSIYQLITPSLYINKGIL